MKNLLKKSSPSGNINSDEFQRGLLEWRNTPSSDGQSPAQILLGRQAEIRYDDPATETDPCQHARENPEPSDEALGPTRIRRRCQPEPRLPRQDVLWP